MGEAAFAVASPHFHNLETWELVLEMPLHGPGRSELGCGNLALVKTGTPLAAYTSSKSARPFDAKPRVSRWGGARNSASRTSDALSLEQARGIIEAAQFACAIGLPLNRHVTIHLERAGVPDCEAAAAIGKFLTLVRDWLRKGGELEKQSNNSIACGANSFAYLWVRENGDAKGSHVHILMHIPAGRQWNGWRLRRWLTRVTGSPYRAGIVQTARIGRSVTSAALAPQLYQVNLAKVVAYVVKGVSWEAARELGLANTEYGGRLTGKRCATSQNIGRAVRKSR